MLGILEECYLTVSDKQCDSLFPIKKGRKEVFYLTTNSTHFIYGYMVKDHSDSERGNQLLSLHGLLFLISSKGSFMCTIPKTG